MDLAFECAGFDVHWSNDLDGTSCQTYQTNFNTENVIGQVENHAKSLKRFSEVDRVFGGPPCQGSSVAGKMDLDDPRSKLVYQFMDIISVLRPKSFVMENVPSLATLNKFTKFREQLVQHEHALGYATDLKIFPLLNLASRKIAGAWFFVGVLGKREVDLRHRSRAYLKTAPSTLEAISDLGIQGSDQNPCTCGAADTSQSSCSNFACFHGRVIGSLQKHYVSDNTQLI